MSDEINTEGVLPTGQVFTRLRDTSGLEIKVQTRPEMIPVTVELVQGDHSVRIPIALRQHVIDALLAITG